MPIRSSRAATPQQLLRSRRFATSARAGRTLIEQAMVLAISGLLVAMSARAGGPLLDAFAVETASQDIVDLIATAREIALARQAYTAVRIQPALRRLVVHSGRDTLATAVLPPGLALRATRDSLAYAPGGLGYGAANLSLIVSRGRSADTVTVSRLGRVARSGAGSL